MISIIVAIAQNGVIGKDNQLLWHLSEDLKRFKALTTGHTVVMGRKTYDSLPFRPLKNRRNIIISRNMPEGEGYEVVRNIDTALVRATSDKESFIIGGEQIYRETVNEVDQLIVTWIYRDFEGDTFFPKINPAIWGIKERSGRMLDEASGLEYEYVTYEKI